MSTPRVRLVFCGETGEFRYIGQNWLAGGVNSPRPRLIVHEGAQSTGQYSVLSHRRRGITPGKTTSQKKEVAKPSSRCARGGTVKLARVPTERPLLAATA